MALVKHPPPLTEREILAEPRRLRPADQRTDVERKASDEPVAGACAVRTVDSQTGRVVDRLKGTSPKVYEASDDLSVDGFRIKVSDVFAE